MRPAALAAVVALAGCRPPAFPSARFPDTPMQLGDESDREQAIDQLWTLAPGDAREPLRREVADALARRIRDAVGDDQPFVAETLLFELCSLWRDDPRGVGRGLADHVALIRDLHAMFAKSGSLQPTV
ncbi:MAG TPA: hypothetical protein VLX92_35030, partial [Kofleriaceae bacterium]|nr:hypothetical protein [Kofleriaceae bacterium]